MGFVQVENRPNRLSQYCTQFKPFWNKTFFFQVFRYHLHVNATLNCKHNTQRILIPGDFNWVRH